MSDLIQYLFAFVIYCRVCYLRTHYNFMPTYEVLESQPQQPNTQPRAAAVQPVTVPKKDTITRFDKKSGVVEWGHSF